MPRKKPTAHKPTKRSSGIARNCPAPKPASALRKGGEDARAEAMRLLAEGHMVVTVAEQVGVAEKTVRRWRDSPDGQAALRKVREARAAQFRDAAEGARRIIRESLEAAAQVLVDDLRSTDPEVRNRAARTLLDRGGVPRTERVETATVDPVDLSKLDDDELREWKRLRAKAKKGD